MLPTFCPPTIWGISLEFYRKLSILVADDFLGACYRKAMTPKSYGLYFFPNDSHMGEVACLRRIWQAGHCFGFLALLVLKITHTRGKGKDQKA